MSNWKGVASSAACAVMVAAGFAWGDEGLVSGGAPHFLPVDQQPLMFDEPATAPSTEPAPVAKKPLMALLGLTPIGKALDSANINIYGYFEGGYTASFSAPPKNFIAGNVFNPNHERIKLDQIDFNIERTVDAVAAAKNHTFDVGGHIEFQYGYDTRFYHSNGLFSYYVKNSSPFASRPENQMDLLQAYVDFAVPIGNGLRIRAGKFVTLLGAEVIDAPQNAFYSHSYLFGYAIPFTHTGILANYTINDHWSVQGGVTRGWNQSVNDNNGAADFLGDIAWTPNPNDSVTVNLSEGPEAAKDNHDWWTVVDVIYTHKFSDKLSATLNADYGDAPHALATAKSAQWGGVALYGSYILNDYVTLNARGEWYDDYNGFTLGAVPYLSIYEVTLGATITPMPQNDILKNFQVRPEIRGDIASGKAFDAATDRYQFQFAVDAYFNF